MKKIILFLSFFFTGLVSAQEVEANIDDIKEVAETGNVKAQFILGTAYYLGLNGAEQDYEKAFYWWKKAAEQGNPEAQVQLGLCYSGGIGVEKSKSKAIYWLRKACENFNDEACEFLNKINKNENY